MEEVTIPNEQHIECYAFNDHYDFTYTFLDSMAILTWVFRPAYEKLQSLCCFIGIYWTENETFEAQWKKTDKIVTKDKKSNNNVN